MNTSWDRASKPRELYAFSFVLQAFRQVLSQMKKVQEEAFKAGGEASASWKGKQEVKKEEAKDEKEEKAGWVFVSACAGQAPWR